MKRGTTTLLKAAIFVIWSIILALCLWLPGLTRYAAEIKPEYAYLRFPILVGMYISAIPFYLALYQALKILSYIEKENAFSESAVLSLRYIKNCAITYLIGLFLLILKSALHTGIAIIGFAIIFASLVISVFSALVQELLRSALKLKAENDLTV